MTISGYTNGVMYATSQGDIWSTPLVIDSIKYVSGTGGPGVSAKVMTLASTAVIFQGTVDRSYGEAVNVFAGGKVVNGVQVLSLPEGYVEVTLR